MPLNTIPNKGLTSRGYPSDRLVTPIIINGDMSVAQRGTSTSSISNNTLYPCSDRFQFQNGNLGTWTASQDTNVPTGQGFSKSFKIACTTADATPAAGDVLNVAQKIEGQNLQHLKFGTSNADSLTVSFWVKCNKTGNGQVNLINFDANRIISNTYTINAVNTWEKKIIAFSGDTTGSIDNDNGASFVLEWYLDSGTDFSSGTMQTSWTSRSNTDRNAATTLSLGDSTSNYWQVTGVQLEVGEFDSTTIPSFPFESFDVNLQRCLRYCQKWVPNSGSVAMRLGNGAIMDTQNMYFVAFPSVEMRTKPSLTLNSTTDWRIFHRGTTATTTNLTFETHGTNQVFNFLATVSSGLTSGDCGQLIGNSTNNYALFDAEL
jgi:hypothetical protein